MGKSIPAVQGVVSLAQRSWFGFDNFDVSFDVMYVISTFFASAFVLLIYILLWKTFEIHAQV